MVGLCGVLGDADPPSDAMVDALRWTGREHRSDYRDATAAVSAVSHDAKAVGGRPARSADGDVLFWAAGTVHGTSTPSGYESFPGFGDARTANRCARLFDRFGYGFVGRANGTFVCLAYEPETGDVRFLSDRFGSYPIYYARAGDALVFSTHVGALVEHPAVDAAVDPELLAEYCSLGRVHGLETPLRDVEQLPPGAVTLFDSESGALRSDSYWRPRYRPLDAPFSYFVDRFVDLLERQFEERFAADADVGVLLSGGSDSRLLLSAADDRFTAYHLSDWRSDETCVAERAADAAGVEFRWFRRGDDYHARVLDAVPPMMNFYGRFDQAHVAGYADEVVDDVDVLVSGLYADVLFRGLSIPSRRYRLGPLGRLPVPVSRGVDSPEAYLSELPSGAPAYLSGDVDVRETVRENLRVEADGTVVDHGATYDSFDDFVRYHDFYPLSNDPDLFYWSLEQTTSHWTPFLDNRMVDLALRMPAKYQLRRNISNAAVRRLDPELAGVPNASTGVPLDRPFPRHYVGELFTTLRRKFLRDDTPAETHYGHHPWTNERELLRNQSFPRLAFRDAGEAIRRAPFLDGDGLRECYEAHLDGENNALALFTLLSTLGMPLFERAAGTADGVPERVAGDATG